MLRILQLVMIVPGGRSKVLDRVGLALWSGVSLGLTLTSQIPFAEANLELLKKHDVYSLLVFMMQSVNPVMVLTLTIPSIHFLVSNNSALFCGRNGNNIYAHKALFFVDMFMVFTSGMSYVWLTLHSTSESSIALRIASTSTAVFIYFLMAVTSFMLGLAMSHLKSSTGSVTVDHHKASQTFNDFISLKTGCSFLIFMVYAVRAMSLTITAIYLVSGNNQVPFPILTVVLAYSAVDLVYVNAITTEAYDYIQSIILKLR